MAMVKAQRHRLPGSVLVFEQGHGDSVPDAMSDLARGISPKWANRLPNITPK
jgi:hypothetical protein